MWGPAKETGLSLAQISLRSSKGLCYHCSNYRIRPHFITWRYTCKMCVWPHRLLAQKTTEQKALQREAVGRVSRGSSVCCQPTARDSPVQAEVPTHPRLLGGKGLPTWTDEDIFHGQHGCDGKQQIFTVKRSSFYDSTAQVGREGKLHQEFPQPCHVASPYPRKKIQTRDSTTPCVNVNRNRHTLSVCGS